MTGNMLPQPLVLYGVTAPGQGKAVFFTRLPWVARAFADKLDLDIWPGTFNVRIAETRSLGLWAEVKLQPGIEIEPPDATACVARCYRAQVNGEVTGAIVVPHVDAYPADLVEIVAAQSIRSTLSLEDGDPVTLRVLGPFEPSRLSEPSWT